MYLFIIITHCVYVHFFYYAFKLDIVSFECLFFKFPPHLIFKNPARGTAGTECEGNGEREGNGYGNNINDNCHISRGGGHAKKGKNRLQNGRLRARRRARRPTVPRGVPAAEVIATGGGGGVGTEETRRMTYSTSAEPEKKPHASRLHALPGGIS